MSRATSVPGRCRSQMWAVAAQPDLARVGDDELGPVCHRLLDLEADDGVVFGGVGSDGEDAARSRDVGYGIGHGAAAEARGQTGHSGRVSETGTVVDTVCAQNRPGKFLHQVVFLVSAFSRRDDSQTVRA